MKEARDIMLRLLSLLFLTNFALLHADFVPTVTPTVLGPHSGVFFVNINTPSLPLTVTMPSGWDADVSSNSIDWFSTSPTFDLKAGGLLSGLSFQSNGPPGDAVFVATGSDPLTGAPTSAHAGTTIGPITLIPEPNAAVCVTCGFALVVFASLWKRIRLTMVKE
jgi:hypothetical protein